ncbi:alpha/beta hydrolase-fold protein [uncultured Varibaculum sp.]|uniref:alpha/beta hydrolase-fold protein n=1 Tax=uncultured Varibaculum sp. TaxID=413896 RepID=UPI002805DE20|nr:alpha/beta hydrolase-fold protein [uncultured Varibaculum sp.]
MLTSLPFVILFCAAAVALLLALPFMIRKTGRYLRSVLVVLLVAVIQVVAVGLLVNLPMQYVSTPSELWQMVSNQQNRQVKISDTQRGSKIAAKKSGRADKRSPAASEKLNPLTAPALPGQEEWIPSFKPLSNGRQLTVFSGSKSGVKEQVIVWTPEGYDPGDKSTTYNVLEFIHGYPGSPVSVALALDFSNNLQKAIDSGEIAPTIVVIPEGNVDLKAPTCADVKNGAQTATWLSFDVPKMVRSSFPNVSDKRKDWMIAGNSSGAYCSARLGILYGDVFGTSAVLSGYDQPIVGSWGGKNSTGFRDNTLSVLASQKRPWPLNMYVSGARLDKDSLHLAKALSQTSYKPGDRVQLHIAPKGGHNWAIWREQMPELYRWWEQVRSSDAPKTAQVKGVDSALLPDTAPGVFSLMGWGTMVLAGVVAILALAVLIRRVPKVMKAGSRATYLRALVGSIVAMLLVIVAVMLPINRLGEFYTSLAEIVQTLTGAG